MAVEHSPSLNGIIVQLRKNLSSFIEQFRPYLLGPSYISYGAAEKAFFFFFTVMSIFMVTCTSKSLGSVNFTSAKVP